MSLRRPALPGGSDLLGEFVRRIIDGRYSLVAQQVEEFRHGHRGQSRGLNQSQVSLLEQAKGECAVDIDWIHVFTP